MGRRSAMVEIIKCPNCQRQLQVPSEHLGQTVQCPECRQMFVAQPTTVSAKPMPAASASAPKPRYDDESDELPRRRRREREFDDDEDDEFDDFGPRTRVRNRMPPHRGGMIMALGLVALVGGFSFCAPALLGPVAWVMGSWDLREMRDGRMDPEGEGLTRAGQICGRSE